MELAIGLLIPPEKLAGKNLTIFHPMELSLSKEIEHAICNKAEKVMGL